MKNSKYGKDQLPTILGMLLHCLNRKQNDDTDHYGQ